MTELRGFELTVMGTYVLLEDVIDSVRAYAQSLDDPNAGALIHELATWLGGEQESPPAVEEPERVEPIPLSTDWAEPEAQAAYGAEALDESPDIERVEVYPDPPEDPNPKWYARSVDTGGYIVQVTGGSFDQEWVIQNASERWPNKIIHLLKNAGEDSKWIEDGTRGVFPSKGPPVRRLWAGAGR